MGKQQKGINDGFSGSVGPAVGYLWRGKWCMRSKPVQVRNPRTARQQESRNKLVATVRLAASMRDALRLGMHRCSLERHMTESNYFIHENQSCFVWCEGHLEVDYPTLLLADGPRRNVLFGSLERVAENRVEVNFGTPDDDFLAEGDDLVYLYAWCPSTSNNVVAPPVFRYDGRASIRFPRSWDSREVWFYGWVQDHDGCCSPSRCLGSM